MKKQRNVLLLFACIMSCLSVALAVVAIVFLIFDIGGIATMYQTLMLDAGYAPMEIDSNMTMLYLEAGLAIFVNAYFANFYIKALKFKVDTPQFGRKLITQGVFQIFFAAGLPGVFAIIAGFRMANKSSQKEKQEENKKAAYMSEYKFEAMSQAVARLKELKDNGVISEEEYYANLNKILES